MVKPSYCFLNVALHVKGWTESVKKKQRDSEETGVTWKHKEEKHKREQTKNEARESLRERREGTEGEEKNGPSAQNYSGEKQAADSYR